METSGLLSGTVFDNKFVILEPLGAGGMGSVYKARQIGFERIVALKLLNLELADSDDSAARLEREARILSMLNHVGIARFFLYGVSADQIPYLAIEYLEGRSLRSKLSGSHRMTWRQTVALLVQVCDALSYAHKQGIIHRDLKPENIMIRSTDGAEKVVLIDFGLSKLTDPDMAEVQKLTRTGDLIGSVNYLSPELCKGLRPDLRSDIYAVGVILYESLSGKLPFSADTPMGVIFKQANEPPLPLDVQTLGIPVQLKQVIEKCIAKNPDNRYQTADELNTDLKAVLENRLEQIDIPVDNLEKNNSRVVLALTIALFLFLAASAIAFYMSQGKAIDPNAVLGKNQKKAERPLSSDNSLALMSIEELNAKLTPTLLKYHAEQALQMTESWFRIHSESGPLSPKEMSMAAIVRGRVQDAKTALVTYEEAIKALAGNPKTTPGDLAQLYAAQLAGYRRVGKRKLISEPAKQLEQMLSNNDELPDNLKDQIRYYLAEAKVDEGLYKEALDFIDENWKDFSTNSKLLKLRAICFFHLGRTEEAKSAALESARVNLATQSKIELKDVGMDILAVREAAKCAEGVSCYDAAFELLETELKEKSESAVDRTRGLALIDMARLRMLLYLKRKAYAGIVLKREQSEEEWRRKVKESIRDCQEAADLFSRFGDRMAEAVARQNLAYYYLLLDDQQKYEEITNGYFRLYSAPERASVTQELATALNTQAARALACGWRKEAARVFQKVEDLYASLGDGANEKREKAHAMYQKASAPPESPEARRRKRRARKALSERD